MKFVLFMQFCSTCHADIGAGGGTIPDLGYSSDAVFKVFRNILLDGALEKTGMPNFSGRLNETDVSAIRNYILANAKTQILRGKNMK
ncbi:MAG: cytochrome c [Chitinophagaceae bacterium]|nr:MAG: cytochrome c [Chitinophagaceae bacterium]